MSEDEKIIETFEIKRDEHSQRLFDLRISQELAYQQYMKCKKKLEDAEHDSDHASNLFWRELRDAHGIDSHNIDGANGLTIEEQPDADMLIVHAVNKKRSLFSIPGLS